MPVDRTAPGELTSVSCPSSTQCTGVDSDGQVLTFDRAAPGHASHAVIDPGVRFNQVACPSTSQCTAIAGADEVTFNPAAPGAPAPATIANQLPNQALNFLACPSVHECVAVDNAGGAFTFDPSSPGAAVRTPLNDTVAGIEGFACASALQCTAVDDYGGALTFNPAAHAAPPRVDVAGTRPLEATACPASSECVSLSSSFSGGNVAVAFNPEAGTTTTVTALAAAAAAVACPSPSQCTAIDFSGAEETFNPTSGATISRVLLEVYGGPGAGILSVSCPALKLCVAVNRIGHEISFDPTSSASPVPVMIDSNSGSRLLGVACPDLSQCTAIDDQGQETTFDPNASGPPAPVAIDRSRMIKAIACPGVGQCTAVGGSLEVTFDPRSPGAASAMSISGATGLDSVSCPSATQCTAVDSAGHEVTFDPHAAAASTVVTIDATLPLLLGISCPTTHQCTAIDDYRAITFDPASPASTSSVMLGFRVLTLTHVACSSATQCTATAAGQAMTFDPASPGSITTITLDPTSLFAGIGAIACPSGVECVAVDTAGAALEFDPQVATSPVVRTTLLANQQMLGVACPSSAQCTAVSSDGYQITGRAISPTSTRVSCSPATFAPGDLTACTATVTGGQTTPAGSVGFTHSGSGSVYGTPCRLSGNGGTAGCTVLFTAFSLGDRTLTASYGGDAAHRASSGSTTVSVTLPASTKDCLVVARGRIAARDGDPASFSGWASAVPPQGHEVYRDMRPATRLRIRSITVAALTCGATASQASVFGMALIRGGGAVEYRIDVALTRRRHGNDTYRIRLSDGYDSGAQGVRHGAVAIFVHSRR